MVIIEAVLHYSPGQSPNGKKNLRHMKQIAIVSLIVLSVTGCAAKKNKTTFLNYTQSAAALYEEGVIAYERERWTDALDRFSQVVTDFPYSRYAPLAELKTADCHFFQGSHPEAAVEYEQFLKAHPTHPMAHYAAFMKSRAYYEQIPGEFFITPPAHERDQTATRDARSALAKFIRTWPDSEHMPAAKELYVEVESALVRHELYVADFYLHRDKRNAAALRLDSVAKQFPGSPLVPDAMFLEAITYLEMGRKEHAERIFNQIISLFPDNHQAVRARRYLDALATSDEEGKNNG